MTLRGWRLVAGGWRLAAAGCAAYRSAALDSSRQSGKESTPVVGRGWAGLPSVCPLGAAAVRFQGLGGGGGGEGG